MDYIAGEFAAKKRFQIRTGLHQTHDWQDQYQYYRPCAIQAVGNLQVIYGKRAKCNNNYPNCEGIVIEYTDLIKEKMVLMMGDVNYASFNMARLANKDAVFAAQVKKRKIGRIKLI